MTATRLWLYTARNRPLTRKIKGLGEIEFDRPFTGYLCTSLNNSLQTWEYSIGPSPPQYPRSPRGLCLKARRDPPILDLHALFIRQIFILFPVNGLRIVGKNAFIQLTLVNPDQLFWPSIDEISVWGMTLRAGRRRRQERSPWLAAIFLAQLCPMKKKNTVVQSMIW